MENIVNPKKLHNIVPFLMSILGIYVFSLGIVSVISGSKLIVNISFFQLHFGGTASVLIGIFMIWVGSGLRARTRVSWYSAIFLILTSLLSILVRIQGFSLIYFDMIGVSANIFMLSLLLKYRNEYIFPSRTIFLPVEGKLALASISISVIYGVAGTMFLGDQFNPPVHNLYTAIYYSSVVLTTIGFGDILPVTNTARLFTVSVAVLGIASFLGAITTFIGPVLQQRMSKVTVIVNSSKNAEKLEDFCDETIDISKVLNDYMLKNKTD